MVQVFGAVERDFLETHPCVSDVAFSFGSSATLAAQVANGAPADVFVSASRATMETAVSSGRVVGEPVVFARNEASIMLSADSAESGSVESVADLADESAGSVRVGVCVASAPCGVLADRVLARAGSSRAEVADTEAASVEDLVTKIELGELDAGLVYRSDCAEAASSVRCVTIPSAQNATTEYLVAALGDTSSTRAWIAFMRSEQFLRALIDTHGFLAP